MQETWADIIAAFREKRGGGDTAFQAASRGVEEIAALIAQGPLSFTLFGWTSMHDLCIQQTDTTPYAGPHLRISPLSSGMIEFRYIDTAVVSRQWQRTVPTDAASTVLMRFLGQLGWMAGGIANGDVAA